MKDYNIDTIAMEMGHCCAASFLKMEEIKAVARGWPGISPAFLMKKTGLAYSTCKKLKRKWQDQEITCRDRQNCLKHKWGEKDPNSAIDPSIKAFQGLRGQSVSIYALKFGNHEAVREAPITPATIVDVSRVPWLWIKFTLGEDRELYLGDSLWVENIAYGTVIDLEGRIVYLLLPGHRHKSRRKG